MIGKIYKNLYSLLQAIRILMTKINMSAEQVVASSSQALADLTVDLKNSVNEFQV